MPTYETTAEQQQQLLTDGFALLPGALPAALLARWRDLAQRLEAKALAAHAESKLLHGAAVVEGPAGPRLIRYDDLLGQDADAVLDLLACPAILAIAREMCGRDAVPLQADILYKHPHSVVPWHQDAPHPRGYPYLNVGIYLDDARAEDGCLRYVPGTQHGLQDICALAQDYGWEPPGVVEQPAAAGDILVQDAMVLHGSPPKRSPGARRTIYVELRAAAGAESNAQPARWLALRKRWMGLVARRADAADYPPAWRDDLPSDLGDDSAEAAAIMNFRSPPIPAAYCPYPVETLDYPTPSDLRND